MKQPNPNSLSTKATLLLASTLTVMSGATIAPSLPAMQEHFAGAGNVALWVRLVLTVPALFIVIGSPIAGLIADRLGRKPLLAVSAALYGIAGGSGLVLDSLPAILCGRALLGLAVAGVMVSATTLIADYYTGPARASFMGLQAAFMGLGGVLFLTTGGYLADLNWRLPFLIYLFSWLLLPMIVLFIFEGSRHNPDPSVLAEQKTSSAPAPVGLMVLVYGTAMLAQIIFYLVPVQLPFYLKSLTNAGAAESGLAIAFLNFFSGFASIAYGKIKQRLAFIRILNLSLGLYGIGYCIIGFAGSYGWIVAGLAIAGLGLGLLMPNLTVWLSGEVPVAIRGRALGGLTTFMFLGQFLSPVFSQPLSQQVGLPVTYSAAGGLLLLLALALLGMKQQVMAWVASPAKTP
ncbi:MAG: MFS transporter [Oscillatoria princeps RMCB-10]|jgi:MFS family permease|nr:MFS transporter [Oscillatoria princeps RMCB-10]